MRSRHRLGASHQRLRDRDSVEITFDPLPILDVLAAGGADLAVRLNGRTLLHLATAKGELKVAAWLVDRGADLARTDASGKTPYDLAGVRSPGSEITDAQLATFARGLAPGGPFATVAAMARANVTPMSDEAREVFAQLHTTPR